MFKRVVSLIADAAVLGLAAGCATAAILGQVGRFNARLDLLNHFAPIWLIGSVLGAVHALTFARALRGWMIGAGLVGLVASAALILPELTRPIRPAIAGGSDPTVKLIQFNTWDHNPDVDATAAWVDAQNPDLVLMQEAERPMRQAMVRRGYHAIRGVADSMIFSRRLPVMAPYRIPADEWKSLPSFSRATFDGPGGRFSVISVHLKWPTQARQDRQIEALAKLASHYPNDRLILAGDFNLTPWSFALRRLDARLGLERRDRAIFSWPVRLSPDVAFAWPAPFLPIDHLYAGEAWRTVSLERGPSLRSDHAPLIAVLALRGSGP